MTSHASKALSLRIRRLLFSFGDMLIYSLFTGFFAAFFIYLFLFGGEA